MQEMWPKLKGLKWLHSASAGLDSLLFPELIDSDVIVSNAKGVYSHSLAEYALTCCNWFAKDLRRMRAAQSRSEWDPFDVEELRGVAAVTSALQLGTVRQNYSMFVGSNFLISDRIIPAGL